MLEAHEGTIRLTAFLCVFTLMVLLESLFPKRSRIQSRLRRWPTNIFIVIVDTLALRIVFPVLAVGVASAVAAKGWGLFALTGLPVWFEVVLAVILLDLAIYWQHVISHRVPILWRVHRVHHTDRDIDVTTALRFHPIEILLSMVYKLFCISLLGPAAVAVFIFEVLLNGFAMFNHANLALPRWVDRLVRQVFVTPDMHRIHHSSEVSEVNANYGFCLSVWDRIFASYTSCPALKYDGMKIGLVEYQTEQPGKLVWSLLLPFRPVTSVKKEKADD